MTIENPVRAHTSTAATVRGVILVSMMIGALLTTGLAVQSIIELTEELGHGSIAATLVTDGVLRTGTSTVDGSYGTADVAIRAVPGGLLALGAAAIIAGIAARIAVGAVFVLVCLRVLRSAPFSGGFALGVTVLGGSVMIGGLLESGLTGLRDLMLGELLTERTSTTWPTVARFDPSLIAIGLGVMLVGLLLDHAWRLQHASDGLV